MAVLRSSDNGPKAYQKRANIHVEADFPNRPVEARAFACLVIGQRDAGKAEQRTKTAGIWLVKEHHALNDPLLSCRLSSHSERVC